MNTPQQDPPMPRIPYIFPEVGESEVADAVRQRRKNGKLIGLDGVLLNAPAIASGYSQLLGAVRTKSSLQADLRELLVKHENDNLKKNYSKKL